MGGGRPVTAPDEMRVFLNEVEVRMKMSTDGDTIWYGQALPLLREDLPRLLALARAGAAVVENVRDRIAFAPFPAGADLVELINAYDSVAAGTGGAGESGGPR